MHGYGDVCQVVTELAFETHYVIRAEALHAFNQCLDDAIAGAVTAYGRQREMDLASDGTERREDVHTVRFGVSDVRSGDATSSTTALHKVRRSSPNVSATDASPPSTLNALAIALGDTCSEVASSTARSAIRNAARCASSFSLLAMPHLGRTLPALRKAADF